MSAGAHSTTNFPKTKVNQLVFAATEETTHFKLLLGWGILLKTLKHAGVNIIIKTSFQKLKIKTNKKKNKIERLGNVFKPAIINIISHSRQQEHTTCSLSLIFLSKTEGFTKLQDFLRCLNKGSFELLSWSERDLGRSC